MAAQRNPLPPHDGHLPDRKRRAASIEIHVVHQPDQDGSQNSSDDGPADRQHPASERAAQDGHASDQPQKKRSWLKKLTNLRVLIPAVISIGALAYVISIAVAPQSGAELLTIFRSTWWIFLLLTLPYLAVRAWIWDDLLKALKLDIERAPMLVAFAVGEMTKNLPAGIYVQNYVLARLERFGRERTARATTATTAMLGLEAALVVPAAAIMGWPGASWVRWALVGVVVAWLVVLGAAWLLVHYGAKHAEHMPGWLSQVTKFIKEFLEAGVDLVRWRTTVNLAPTAVYLFIYAFELYLITHALGLKIGLAGAVTTYMFLVLTVILVPIPLNFGPPEFTGLSVLVSFGVTRSTAALAMLALRLMAEGMTIVVCSLLLFFYRAEWSQAMRNKPAANSGTDAKNDSDQDHQDNEDNYDAKARAVQPSRERRM